MKTLDIFELPLYWEMVNAEKITLFNLLNEIKPSVSIEIGTKKGGSLQLISALSSVVYSLDIDPAVEKLGSIFKNVNFITGDSKETFPRLIQKLANDGIQPDFILIDGNHSFEGVKNDIQNILKIEITRPLTVLMHDSFNPECRKGMLEPDYEINSFINFVDIDFVQGIYSPNASTKGEMWGGFGIIHFDPATKKRNPLVMQSNIYSYERIYHLSKHFHFKATTLTSRVKSFIFRKIFIQQ